MIRSEMSLVERASAGNRKLCLAGKFPWFQISNPGIAVTHDIFLRIRWNSDFCGIWMRGKTWKVPKKCDAASWPRVLDRDERGTNSKVFMMNQAIRAMFGLSLIFSASTPCVSGENESETKAKSFVYAKVAFPAKSPYWRERSKGLNSQEDGSVNRVVESWFAKAALKQHKCDVRAATSWMRISEGSEPPAELFAGWGCPVTGRIVDRTQDGRIEIALSGWTPGLPEIRDHVISADIGARGLAVVYVDELEQPLAFVGLIVTPAIH